MISERVFYEQTQKIIKALEVVANSITFVGVTVILCGVIWFISQK